MENRGISITGGSVSAGAMAAGERAVAVNQSAPEGAATLEDLRSALRQLSEAVAADAASLEDPEQSMAVVRLAEQEVAKESPDKGRLAGFLQVITSGAGATSSVAAAVTAVETALRTLL